MNSLTVFFRRVVAALFLMLLIARNQGPGVALDLPTEYQCAEVASQARYFFQSGLVARQRIKASRHPR